MAYLNLAAGDVNGAVAGGGFEVECATERHAVTVSLSPFFDPSGERMRVDA
jgi:glycine cleavage system aminomethyltransferase T